MADDPNQASVLRQLSDRYNRQISQLTHDLQQLPGLAGGAQAMSDALGAGVSMLGFHGQGVQIHFGVVHDCYPYSRVYRVFGDDLSVIPCTRLGESGNQVVGSYDATTLTPGVSVFYITHPMSSTGFIIGTVPWVKTGSNQGMSDWHGQGTNTGILTDPSQATSFQYGGISDFSGRTPMNSQEVGEFCRIAETGVQIFLDSMHTSMQVDEATGLWLFYWDQLCRLAGVNFQRWTGGSELESYDDEGEHMWYEGVATFPWEQQGQLNGPANVVDVGDPSRMFNDPTKGLWEPIDPALQGFHRLQTYKGYLGQGEKRILTAPPNNGSTLKYTDSAVQMRGLFSENLTIGGHWAVESASKSEVPSFSG